MRPSTRPDSNVVPFRRRGMDVLLASTALLAGQAWAHPPAVEKIDRTDVPVWLASTHGPVLEPTKNVTSTLGGADVSPNAIPLGPASEDLQRLAVRLAVATYPCAGLALMKLNPADATGESHRRETLRGLPSATTVVLAAHGAEAKTVSQSLVPIWDGPYATLGGLHVEIDTTTVPAGPDTYLSSVSSRVVNVDGVPIPNGQLEPRFRFLWSSRDGSLLGVFRAPE